MNDEKEPGVSIELVRSLDSDMGVLTGGGSAETFSERMNAALAELNLREPPK